MPNTNTSHPQSIAADPGPIYHYRLHSTGHSSARYGPIESRWSAVHTFWTQAGCHTYFGHEECLKSKQRGLPLTLEILESLDIALTVAGQMDEADVLAGKLDKAEYIQRDLERQGERRRLEEMAKSISNE